MTDLLRYSADYQYCANPSLAPSSLGHEGPASGGPCSVTQEFCKYMFTHWKHAYDMVITCMHQLHGIYTYTDLE